MPIFSFLVYPEAGMKDRLIEDLSGMENCEVKPADNRDVLILVTDTPDDRAGKELVERIKALPSLQGLSMTFGHTD